MGYHDIEDGDSHLYCLYRVVLRDDVILEKDYIGRLKKGLVKKGSYDIKMAVGDVVKNRRLMAFKKDFKISDTDCKIINPALNL